MKTLDDEFDEVFDRVLKEVIDFMKKSDKVFNELAMSTSKITPTVVKDSILATGLMKVYHHGFDS